MNSTTSRPANHPWVWQVTALCFLLGLLLTGAMVSNVRRSGGAARVGQPLLGPAVRTDAVNKLEKEIADLRNSKTTLENSIAKGNDQVKTLNDELQKVKLYAGLTDTEGPGIVLTLRDSVKRPPANRSLDAEKYLIHDVDLQQVVHELFASGAEAIAIRDQRVTSRTAIRCVGPTIQVNGVPVSPPYTVQAIGDPATLVGGLSLPYGILDGIRRYDPAMYRLERKSKLVIRAFSGSTEVKYCKALVKNDQSKNQDTAQP